MPPPRRRPPAEHRFGHDDARARLKEHSAAHYAGLYNVMKGVTLAAAGLAALRLLTAGYPPQRWLLLAISVLAIVVSYNGAAVGQMIVHVRTSVLDAILPMALTIAEFILVGLSATGTASEQMPALWFLVLAAWQALAAAVVTYVALRLKDGLYTARVWGAVAAYRQRLAIDAVTAAASSVVSLCFWLARRGVLPAAGAWEYAFLALTTATLVGALVHHEQTRRELVRNLGATS